MTRFVFHVLCVGSLMVASNLHAADSVSCDGSVDLPASYASGNCTNGQCSVLVSGSSYTISGSCGGGVTFSASASYGGEFIDGQCNGGAFNAFVSGTDLNFNGTCTQGSFSGSALVSNPTASGTCQADGTVNVEIYWPFAQMQGTCEQY